LYLLGYWKITSNYGGNWKAIPAAMFFLGVSSYNTQKSESQHWKFTSINGC